MKNCKRRCGYWFFFFKFLPLQIQSSKPLTNFWPVLNPDGGSILIISVGETCHEYRLPRQRGVRVGGAGDGAGGGAAPRGSGLRSGNQSIRQNFQKITFLFLRRCKEDPFSLFTVKQNKLGFTT